jgi:uncharacterized membrane protein YGL010W
MSPSAFSLREQLAFYGAYHSNPTNVWIHITCVPLILWSAYVLAAHLPKSDAIPSVHAEWGPYLAFDLNYSTIWAIATELYYFILTPGVTLTHLPVAVASLLTATAYASKPGSLGIAAAVHVVCWLAQFYGHGVHEGRAPALLDNLLGALVLAPLFVHYEVFFKLGLFNQTQKDLHNDVGKLITELKLKKKQVKKE